MMTILLRELVDLGAKIIGTCACYRLMEPPRHSIIEGIFAAWTDQRIQATDCFDCSDEVILHLSIGAFEATPNNIEWDG